MTRLNIPLFVALAASLLSAVAVDARDTLPHQRMIRKRGPAPGPGSIGAAAEVVGLWARQAAEPSNTPGLLSSTGAASSAGGASTGRTSSSSSAAATTSSSSSTSSSQSTSTTASTSSGGLLNSLTASLSTSTSTTSSTSSTSSSSSSTSSSSSSSAAPTSASQQPATSPTAPSLNIATPTSAPTVPPSTSISYVTSVAPAAAASKSAAAKAKTAKITRNTIISLVVIASCIGGAIAIWTVIRKWKLSPSERFDDRMQPIDWTPPGAGAAEDSIEEKTKHRRAGSGASHGSFTSGGVGQSEQGHAVKGAAYSESQHGYGMQPQDFPPPHDFTAGTAQPGGYGQYYGGQQYAGGAPGYADLQRGPSMSESTYSHGASVTRGLSYNRGHAGYEVQPGAGAVPPLPNPYGGEYGYDDYGHQQAGHAGQQPAQGQAYRAY